MTSQTIYSKPASGPSALDGHEFRCSCGERQGTSLSASEAERMANEHQRWHDRMNALRVERERKLRRRS